jgi:hypothetical protein
MAKPMTDESTLTLDFDAAGSRAEALRRKGGRSVRARQRLAEAGVAVDDADRSRDGRARKPPGHPRSDGLRDGPGLPLRNPKHELAARHVSAGLPPIDAMVLVGYTPSNSYWADIVRHEDFRARVAEHIEADRASAGISLPWVQQQLLRIAATDPGAFLEPVPHSSRFRLKNVLDLPVEIRQSISEITFDRHGRPIVRLHDRMKALAELGRMVAPSEVTINNNLNLGARLDAAMGRLSPEDQLVIANALKAFPGGPETAADAGLESGGDGAGAGDGVAVDGDDIGVPRPVEIGDRF